MKFKKTILLLIAIMALGGCNSNNKNNLEIKKLDKAPEGLGNINKTINLILKNTGNIERIDLNLEILDEGESGESQEAGAKEKTKQSEEAHGGSEENSSKESGKSQDGSSEEDSSQGGSSQGSKSASKDSEASSSKDEKEKMSEETWSKIDKSLEELYENLLSYENEAIKKGASQDRLIQLKDTINKMVKAVEEKSILDIYDYGSQSLLHLKPFYDLYKDDHRGEICEIKYNIYQYYLKAITGNKEGAREHTRKMDENINKIRLLIGEDDKKAKELDKVNTSLASLGISLEDNSRRVLILEKDTLIKNLESME